MTQAERSAYASARGPGAWQGGGWGGPGLDTRALDAMPRSLGSMNTEKRSVMESNMPFRGSLWG